MKYKNNGELKGYYEWIFEQKIVNDSDFELTLTNGAGSIFPPDIFNIKEDFLPIIKETITCDDLTMKYFSIIKAIPHKWIVNNNVMGFNRTLTKSNSSKLSDVNLINNDICINKLNIMINRTSVNNLCVHYKDIKTGLSIYLFYIHNQHLFRNGLGFDIYASSCCPINSNLKFNIFFNNFNANCFLNDSMMNLSVYKHKKMYLKIASCFMDKINIHLDDYYFPKAISEKNIYLNIYNYRTYLSAIFGDLFCFNKKNCILKVILLNKINIHSFEIRINENYYYCLEQNNNFYKYSFLVFKLFNCKFLNFIHNRKRSIISGLPTNIYKKKANKGIFNNNIPYRFIISRIISDDVHGSKKIIIIGHLIDNLEKNLYKFSINMLSPKYTLKCCFEPYSKYVQSKIYCINILIEII